MTDSEGIVESLVKEGKISPLTVQLIKEEALCETFGWRPRDLDEMDLFYIDSFSAVLAGRAQGLKNKYPKK